MRRPIDPFARLTVALARHGVLLVCVAAGLSLCAPVRTTVCAQGVTPTQTTDEAGADLASIMDQHLLALMSRTHHDTVHVSPIAVTVDAKIATAIVHFINPSATDTLAALIRVAEGKDTAASPGDTLDPFRLRAAWIMGMPKGVILLPGETRTVTVRLAVPTHLRAGQYLAQLVVHTIPIGDMNGYGTQEHTTKNGLKVTTFMPHLENMDFGTSVTAKIVYRAVGGR